MEGVVVVRETIHELHMKKQNRVILKFDFEKSISQGEITLSPASAC